MVLTPTRRHLLWEMRDRRWHRVRDLAKAVGHCSMGSTHPILLRLMRAGLVEQSPAGFRLAPHVCVSEGLRIGVWRPVPTDLPEEVA